MMQFQNKKNFSLFCFEIVLVVCVCDQWRHIQINAHKGDQEEEKSREFETLSFFLGFWITFLYDFQKFGI